MISKYIAVCGTVMAFAISSALAQGTGVAPQASSSSSSSSSSTVGIGQTLQQDLTKAGFTDVKVMPEAFIVHAKDSHGNPVVMRVGPDSVTEMTEIPKNQKTANTPDATNNQQGK